MWYRRGSLLPVAHNVPQFASNILHTWLVSLFVAFTVVKVLRSVVQWFVTVFRSCFHLMKKVCILTLSNVRHTYHGVIKAWAFGCTVFLLKTLANSITKVIRFANVWLPSSVKRWLIEAAISCQNIWLYVINLASVFSKTSTYPIVLHVIPDCQWLSAWATLCLQCLLKDSVVSDEVEGQTARQEEDKTTLEENAARRFREWDELQWNICTWQQVNCVNCHVFARAS